MNTWSSALVSSFLLLCAAGLMFSHVRTWRRFRELELEPEEFDYRRRQFRRRMQTSAMLGLLAIAIFVGELLVAWSDSVWFGMSFCVGMLIVVIWVGLLAAVDIFATKHHYNRLRQSYVIEQAKLQAELRRIQAKRGNGRA